MKTIFTNDMCAHVWANQSQPFGRSDSMRFEGAVLYSYRTPIAAIVSTPKGNRAALFTSHTYSITTSSKHMPAARNAWSHVAAFTVPNLGGTAGVSISDHAANLEHFREVYEKERAALMRVPCDSPRVRDAYPGETARDYEPTVAHTALHEIGRAAWRYANEFALKIPAWVDGSAVKNDADAIIARRDRLANDPKRLAKREALRAAKERAEQRAEEARAAKRAERLAELLGVIHDWRMGTLTGSLPHDAHVMADGSAMLRVNTAKGVVETSLGAEAPIEHVARSLGLYRAVLAARGTPWQRGERASDDSLSRLGHFTLDRIEADGSVRAGCHTITAVEVEALAATLTAIGAA